MFFQDLDDSAKFLFFEPFIPVKLYRLEPELGDTVPLFDMNMGWLISFVAKEEKVEPADSQNCRHTSFILSPTTTPRPSPRYSPAPAGRIASILNLSIDHS